MNKKEYIAKGGLVCIHCESTDIEASDIIANGTSGVSYVECNACSQHWEDVWKAKTILIDGKSVNNFENLMICPICGNEDILTDKPEADGNNAIEKNICESCGQEYQIIWELINVNLSPNSSDIPLPENEISLLECNSCGSQYRPYQIEDGIGDCLHEVSYTEGETCPACMHGELEEI